LPPDIGANKKFLTRLRKLFTFELSQNWKLQEATNQLQNEFAEQKGKAEEARVSMDNHIACEGLAYREAQNSLTKEFNSCKQNWEQQTDEQLARSEPSTKNIPLTQAMVSKDISSWRLELFPYRCLRISPGAHFTMRMSAFYKSISAFPSSQTSS